MGPCAGGAVYSPAITDFIFMVKETSHMFITGPDVIKTVTGEEVEFEELGGAMSHNSKSGVAHFASDDEDQCLEDTRYLLSFLPQNNLETAPRVLPDRRPDADGPRAGLRSSPTTRTSPTTCATSCAGSSTTASSSRSRSTSRRTSSAASRGSNGYSVGVVGNQPRAMAGVLDIDASVEGGALRAHLRRVQHPAADLRRRARLPARAPRRSGAASSATARSCCTPSPRRPCRRSR